MQPSLKEIFSHYREPRYYGIWLLIGILRVFAFFPLVAIYIIGVGIGELIFWLYGSRRKITIRNLEVCYPDKSSSEIRKLARHHFHFMVYGILATGIGWWAGKEKLKQLTHFKNREYYDAALSEGKNIVLLAPHFVGLEYGGIYLSSERQCVSMYQRNRNALLNELVKSHRSRFGIQQFGSKEPIKGMIRSIRQGHPFYYLPDQDPGRRKGIFVPFFSIPTATFPALGKIAGLTDASVIPCMTRLLPWGRGYEIIFDEPIANYPVGDDIRDTTTMNQVIEKLIDYAPEQYFWSHKRFKTRPEGERDFYRSI